MTLQTSADHATADASLRRRSKSLNYSHYERYISQVDPALDQPKFRAGGGIVVKSGSKKGVRGFTRSIAARLRRRRPNPTLPM
jgi:hypothetical protein